MRAYLFEGGEMQSPRWARLCAALKADEPGERWRLYGHLAGWWCCWTTQPELESGVWFDKSLSVVGSWAQASGTELAWGRALLSAGYIARIEDRYPPPLARQGFVALSGTGAAMLDDCFTYFKTRQDAAVLARYISAPIKRARWAAKLGLDVARLDGDGEIPPGWFGDGGAQGESERPRLEGGVQRVEAGSRMQPAARNVEPRPVTGFGARAPERGTANESSMDMLGEVRAWKYQDPLRACLAMDNSKIAEMCWRQAIRKNRQQVCEQLGTMTETDGRWSAIRCPAKVLMANLRRQGLLGG
ncbi:MAG: hypothetical protein PHR35_08615 [Kiritimatiellae bacterium]|nr:hypothetical protein [Kiritimatiellia bacterium]